jgi:hypothetical protein
VDGVVLWRGTAAGPPLPLPGGLRRQLHPAVAYAWSVEAVGEDGEVLAASGRVRFRVAPPPE